MHIHKKIRFDTQKKIAIKLNVRGQILRYVSIEKNLKALKWKKKSVFKKAKPNPPS